MADKVRELNDHEFSTELKKHKISLVDFYASWCGPCRLFSPIYSEVANEVADVAFFKIDGDANPDCRADLDIPALPYVAAYKDGQYLDGVSTTTRGGLENFIQRVKEKAAT